MLHADETPRAEMLDFVRSLGELAGRVGGSEAERQAQELLAGRLHTLGFDAIVEGAVCPPLPPLVLALHAGVGLLSLLFVPVAPLFAAALAALAGVSFWGELRGGPFLLKGLLMRRITGNLVARLRPPGPGPSRSDANERDRPKIVVVAHADVASSSAVFLPWVRRLWDEREGLDPREGHGRPRSLRSRRLRLHPGSIVLLACVAQAGVALGVALGLRGTVPPVVLGSAALVHLGLGVLAFDWWRSPPVPGANDNGSGLAVLLGLAHEVADRPLAAAELWIVATGDREPDAGGMEAFLFQFGALLDPRNAFVINIDDVGLGDLHIGVSEGRWDRLAYRPFLTGLAERVGRSAQYGPVGLADLAGTTDAGPPTEAGFSAVTVTALVDGRAPSALHTAADTFDALDPTALLRALRFVTALVRATDREMGAGGSIVALDGAPSSDEDHPAPAAPELP